MAQKIFSKLPSVLLQFVAESKIVPTGECQAILGLGVVFPAKGINRVSFGVGAKGVKNSGGKPSIPIFPLTNPISHPHFSRLVSSRLVSSRLVSSRLVSSRLVSSKRTAA
ncbi:hypothetical protein CCP4SC76_5740012 [Gammaproteobacteria bacterium]